MSELSHSLDKILGHTPDDCPFCKRYAAKDYDDDVYEFFGHTVVTYENIKMSMPGHRLFVPVIHEGRLSGDPTALAAAMAAAATWAGERDLTQYNVIASQGGYATQSVLHIHVHITPRGPEDTLPTGWPWRGLMKQHGTTLATRGTDGVVSIA